MIMPQTETYLIGASGLLSTLGDWIDPSVEQKLRDSASDHDGISVLTPAALRAAGLVFEFSDRKLEFRMRIPYELRKTNVVHFGGRGVPPSIAESIGPSRVSAFINARGTQDFNFNFESADSNGRRPTRGDFDGALNIDRTVIESAATYTEKIRTPFQRGDTRIVRDFPGSMIRAAAGDLAYPISGFQRFRQMGGVTVASNFSLQPYRVTLPISNTELFLKSSSKVVVWVNGIQMQVLYLPPGRHDLRNLALGTGLNMIRLDITDATGKTETLTIPWVSQPDLLAPELHQFAYSVGFPSTQVEARREYDRKTPTFSLSHRYGFNTMLTAGFFAQGDHNQQIAGPELVWARTWGTLSFEPAVSRIVGGAHGAAARVRYVYTDYRGPRETQRNFELSLENRSPRFAALGELSAQNVAAYDVSAAYNQNLFWGINGRIAESYQFNRSFSTESHDSHTESLAFVRSWGRNLQTTLTLTRRTDLLNQTQHGAFFLLNWAIGESNHYVNASHDSMNHSSRGEWRYNSPQVVGGYNTGAAVERTPEQTRTDLSADYTGNRGLLSATHNITSFLGARSQQTTSVRAAGSLAYVGGRFGIGRPITDAFAIVASAGPISGQRVEINPNGTEYHQARTDWLGPAVVSDVRSYQYFHLYLDPSKLDPGLDLGRENYDLMPSYKSGTLIEAGTDSTILLAGRLTNGKGLPLGLESGEAQPLSGDPKARPVTMFTNRKGKFRIDGFRPGEYELRFYSEKWKPLRFKIPENQAGRVELGDLTVFPLE